MWVAIFVFFKQKTAYEMRISVWSSDVCSSDLLDSAVQILACLRSRQGQHLGIPLFDLWEPLARAEVGLKLPDAHHAGRDPPLQPFDGKPLGRNLQRAHVECQLERRPHRTHHNPSQTRSKATGRASGRETVCIYALISVVSLQIKKT